MLLEGIDIMGPKAAADALALVQLGAGASTGREGLVKRRRRRKCCNAIATYSLHLYVRCPPYRGHQRDPLGRHPVQDKGWRPCPRPKSERRTHARISVKTSACWSSPWMRGGLGSLSGRRSWNRSLSRFLASKKKRADHVRASRLVHPKQAQRS